MALPATERYNTLAGAINPMAKASMAIAKSIPNQQAQTKLPSPKSFDTTKYSGLTSNLKEGSQYKNVGTVTTEYGGSTNYEKFHPGIDIANKIGTPLYSTVPGKVTATNSGKVQGDKGYGNYVEVQDAQGNRHRYSHLNQAYVKIGDVLKQGQLYGTMGNTGSTYSNSGGDGSHLDYRIWDMYNKYVNPVSFLR